MPQANNRLRTIFMEFASDKGVDDGIGKAEYIIKQFGGTINEGTIEISSCAINSLVDDAIEFLIQEWDYSIIIYDKN